MGCFVGKPSATIATAWDVVSLVIALVMGCIDSRWWCLFCDLLSFLSYEISFQGCGWSCGWPNPCIVLRGHRSLRFLLPRPASTVTLSVTSSVSISSPGRSSRISCLPLTIVMWVSLLWRGFCSLFMLLFYYVWRVLRDARVSDVVLHGPVQVPEVVRTDYQLIDISEDGFVSLHFFLLRI